MKNSTMSLLIFLFILLTVGCITTPIKVYHGPTLPYEKSAVIVVPNSMWLELYKVDGRVLKEYTNTVTHLWGLFYEDNYNTDKFQLLPGKHTLEFYCKMNNTSFKCSQMLIVNVEFEGGKTYSTERQTNEYYDELLFMPSFNDRDVVNKFLSANPHFHKQSNVIRVFSVDLPKKEWVAEDAPDIGKVLAPIF